MKDLRFKIIADFVKDGFNKADASISSLKTKLTDFFGGAKAGWAGVAAGIGAAVAAIYNFFDGIRDKWLDNIKEMNNASSDFADQTMDNLRKIRFQDTEQEKARNVDSIKKQINDRKKALDELETSDAVESIAESGLDWVQGKWRGVQGFDAEDDDARKMKALKQEIHMLEIQLNAASKKDTKDVAEAAKKAEEEKAEAAKKARAERLAADKARHEQGKAWAEEEEAALQKLFERETKLAEEKKKQAAMGAEVRNAARDARYDLASPEEKRRMDLARLRELGKTFTEKNVFGDFANTNEDRKNAALEAIGLRKRMVEEDRASKDAAKQAADAVAREKAAQDEARRAAAFQTLDLGQLFDMRYGQSGQKSVEREQADSLKEAVELLGKIEKKPGGMKR